LWLVVSLIALAVNFDLAALGLWRAYFLEPLFFFLVFIYTVKNQQDRNLIMYAMGGLVIWLAAIAIWQDFTAWNLPAAYDLPNARRLTAVFSYPNALSLLIAPITAWFAGLWLVSKNKTKHLAFLGVIFLGFLLLILAKSEGAILALVVSLLIYIFTVRLPRFFKPSLLIIALVVILLTPMKGYLQSMPRQILDPHPQPPVTSLEIRGHQWSETGDLLADHWLVGAGINGYQKMMAAYHHLPWLEIYLYPHNIFLNFWVELGLFGLLLFVFILIYLFKTCYILLKSKHQLAWPIILAWTTWLVHGLVDVPYFKNDLSILFFVLLAWTILSARDNRASSIVK
jgi:O-antigen ligase